jgi:hypothetical protein
LPHPGVPCMIFWDAAAHEKGSEDARNRREILKIDMVIMRPLTQGLEVAFVRI